jgi:hypothetical protein
MISSEFIRRVASMPELRAALARQLRCGDDAATRRRAGWMLKVLGSLQLQGCRVTARMARPIPRAPTPFPLPVLPLFASSVALRLDCGRPPGLRQGRRLRDPPKRHPRLRELQAPWSGPDHACAPGCAARRPADLQAGRFQRQAGPPPPRDLRDPVKHPGRVQARLEGTRDQLLPSPLLPHYCALSPPPALAPAPWALGR